MKKLSKLLAFALLFISFFALTGCKNNYSVYIFTSTGGYVTIDDSADRISLKEILYYNKDVSLTLNAHENEEYQFLYWLVNTQVYSTEKTINLDISKETVVKAMFEKSGTMSITFVDENNNILSENPVSIQANEIMSNFPTIPVREGYVGNFYCDEDIMLEGSPYPFTTSKTFVLKYIEQKYTISVQYIDCTKDDVTINLLENYDWTVDFNSEIKFTLTRNIDKEFVIYRNNTSNQINANAYGVYTINNISQNETLIVKLNTMITSTPEDDNSNTDNNTDTDNENDDTNTNPDYNLGPSILQCTITFEDNNLPSTTKIVVKSNNYQYDYINSRYYVYKYLDFEFSIEDINLFIPTTTDVYANGERISMNASGTYKLSNVTEDTTITIDMYYTMYIHINYGMVATEYYEDLIDGDFVPFYDAYITLHHSRINAYTSKLDPNTDLVTFYVNKTTKTMTITQFIDYVNSTINTEPEYKISHISLANADDIIFVTRWAKVSYEENSTEVILQDKSYYHQTHYTLHINWAVSE